MAQQLQPSKTKELPDFTDVQITPTTGGVILADVAAYNVAPPNSVSYAENMHNDVLGSMSSRPPLIDLPAERFTDTVNAVAIFEPIGGTAYLYWQEGADKVCRTNALTGLTKATQTGVVSGSKARFEAYRDKLFVVSTGGGVQAADSTTLNFTPVTGLGGIATNPNLISLGFYGMGWFANNSDSTCSLYNSDPIPADPASMTYSTTSQNGAGVVMLPANNNQTITALIPTQQALYVFFQNQILRVFSPNNVDTTPIAYIGTPTQESVVKGKDGYYFYHSTGIYKLEQSTSNGIAQPIEISSPIRSLIRRIGSAARSAVTSWADDDNVYFNLGRLAYTSSQLDRTYVVRFTISTKLWTIYSFYERTINASTFHHFRESTSGTLSPISFIAGIDTSSGTQNFVSQFNNIDLSTINNIADDDGTSISLGSTSSGKEPVFVDYVTHWQDFSFPDYKKSALGISIPSENAAGLTLMCQTDNEENQNSDWVTIGTLTEKFISMFSQFQVQEFNRIRFRVTGNTKGTVVRVYQPIIQLLSLRGKAKK